MKVKDLKKILANIPDDMDVVVSAFDHSFLRIGSGTGLRKAELFPRDRHLSEYYDDANKGDPNNPVIEVFWIDDGRY